MDANAAPESVAFSQANSDGSDPESTVIVAVMDGDPRSWVPMADYELAVRKMRRFRQALFRIVEALDALTDDEQQDILCETEPTPLASQ